MKARGNEPKLAEQVAGVLRVGGFDLQHAGELFLRGDAERALRGNLPPSARVAVAGRDDPLIRPVSLLGSRFTPDLVVKAQGQRCAVTITLLRRDTTPLAGALASALVLSARYNAVVAFVLDRRPGKRDPFGGDEDEPARPELSDAERSFLQQLWERQRVWVEVRRQEPFGWV
ncbi:MAG: hypothetical protein HY332_08230 [Chloroflexi bacterium]|nr:hypothetical protein [Chloroflexota bacterium]